MDGTLVDTERLWLRTTAELAADLGHTLTEEDLPEVLGRAVGHTAAHLCRITRTSLTPDALAEILSDTFSSKVAAEVVPRPGALALLAELSEAAVPTALVSASPRRVVDLVLGSLGAHWFTVTLAAEDTERTKPDPAPTWPPPTDSGWTLRPAWPSRTLRPGSPPRTRRAARCWPFPPPCRSPRPTGSPCWTASNRPTWRCCPH